MFKENIVDQNRHRQSHQTNLIADPGNLGAIPVNQGSGVVPVTTAAAETRTLAIPKFLGQRLEIICDVYVGDATITVASAINQTGNNTITLGAAAGFIVLVASQLAGVLVWRVAANDGAPCSTVM